MSWSGRAASRVQRLLIRNLMKWALCVRMKVLGFEQTFATPKNPGTLKNPGNLPLSLSRLR